MILIMIKKLLYLIIVKHKLFNLKKIFRKISLIKLYYLIIQIIKIIKIF